MESDSKLLRVPFCKALLVMMERRREGVKVAALVVDG